MAGSAQWLQIVVSSSAAEADRVCCHLETLGALAVTLQDAADEPLYETVPHSENHWHATKVIGLFENKGNAAQLAQDFRRHCGESPPPFDIELIEDEVWERRCLEHVRPMRFGQRLWVYPSWHQAPQPQEGAIVTLDPGLAFGTGTHPTTALCLEWLDRQSLGDKTVIDYGCGSGILAIAAVKCGARRVYAIDHDEQAVLASRDNADKNRCSEQVSASLPEQFKGDNADIVLANILAGPLIQLAERLAALCCENGVLVLSGILDEQYDSIVSAYSPRFSLRAVVEKEHWLLMEWTKDQIQT